MISQSGRIDYISHAGPDANKCLEVIKLPFSLHAPEITCRPTTRNKCEYCLAILTLVKVDRCTLMVCYGHKDSEFLLTLTTLFLYNFQNGSLFVYILYEPERQTVREREIDCLWSLRISSTNPLGKITTLYNGLRILCAILVSHVHTKDK